MWNQSQGVLGDDGSGCSDWLYGTWSALFHWKSTLPVAMSISWTTPLITVWFAGPPIDVRSAVAVVYDRISAVFHGVIRNSWPSALSPFPAWTVAICLYSSS